MKGSGAWELCHCSGPRNVIWESFGNNPGKGEQWKKDGLTHCGQGTGRYIGRRLGDKMKDRFCRNWEKSKFPGVPLDKMTK